MKQLLTCVLLCLPALVGAQAPKEKRINYDESKMKPYVLPDPLTCNDGTKVKNVRDWEEKRRPEILSMFANLEYGVTPDEQISVTHTLLETKSDLYGGKATRKQVLFTFTGENKTVRAILMLIIPNKPKGKVPVFVGFNFLGNQSIVEDPAVYTSPGVRLAKEKDDVAWIPGSKKSRWPIEKIIDRGYAVATMCYHDIYPDTRGGRPYSICALFKDYTRHSMAGNEWNAIGAWAWGYCRVADYLETEERIDTNRMASFGHSRLGKTSLWAGAQDTRFKVVISNEAGCAGDALSKRVMGENLGRITYTFSDWFCRAFFQFGGNEEALPFDQHELLALMAPRHVYVASAADDLWSDPKGQYLAAYHAKDVYALYGMKGLESPTPPGLHQPIHNDVGYHIRAGVHDVTEYDWQCYLDYCDKYLK